MAAFADWRSLSEWKRISRYYQAGLANTVFGFSLYALLVWAGLNLFVAQIVTHIAGATFNYWTLSRYAFVGHSANKRNFVLSYGLNYLLNAGVLWVLHQAIASPYWAGLATILLVSALNYLVLRRFVFLRVTPG
ncbi:GtrA family protein [Stakelama tenebrarum]|uniref:GtrA family protein n=1 Tax=Stakelama tenebrarum TaxID=2711215 RepID=A0A6G6Y4B1_9SPHN|nr:GtrA family protein [Sphingosinithalassobacter tenebrarum]QIG79784.1 GtrA family protein [Sphingosinithalassobacter tenebrarum]